MIQFSNTALATSMYTYKLKNNVHNIIIIAILIVHTWHFPDEFSQGCGLLSVRE